MAKPNAQFRCPTASEQLVLEHFQLRLRTEPAELARCDALIVEHHYLQSATLVGEHLRYAASAVFFPLSRRRRRKPAGVSTTGAAAKRAP